MRDAGHADEALTLLREAVVTAPDEPEVYLELATTLLALGRHGQAAAVVAKGLMKDPEDPRLRQLLAEAGEHAVVAAPPPSPSDSVELPASVSQDGPRAQPGDSAFSGNLKQFELLDLLEFLRLNRRTGVLRLVSDGRVAEVHLVDGHLAGGTIAGNARLGKMLLTNGMIPPEALQRAVELQRSAPRPLPLGQVLLSHDFITAETLRPALVDQIKMTLLEITDWTDGTFVFDADEEMVHGLNADPLLLDTTTMMLETVRLRDESRR
jgi:tetratricopeptide (TPR) repeat protein